MESLIGFGHTYLGPRQAELLSFFNFLEFEFCRWGSASKRQESKPFSTRGTGPARRVIILSAPSGVNRVSGVEPELFSLKGLHRIGIVQSFGSNPD